jgi:hypothetical protein
MTSEVRIEPQGDRECLVRFPAREGEIESLIRATDRSSTSRR